MPVGGGWVVAVSLVCCTALAQAQGRRAAELLGMSGQVGVIAPGAHADVIAVQGDPLQDVRVLERVSFVMKDGTVFRSAQPSP